MKKIAYVFLVIFFISLLFATDAFALSYDSNRYYWDCEKIIVEMDQIEDCLKKRFIPLSYYPYIGVGLIFIIGSGLLYKFRRNK
ncbi:MAG: hypothetical protein LRY73_14065 [Bacillus sp. (in: Bacteria)]|nr:hypothetical protein [Bacillus sp. (in: firmicutes)]